MVWETPRSPPKRAYFLFDDHPAINNGYTPNLMIITIIIIEYTNLWYPVISGIVAHKINTKNTLTTGERKNNI